MTQGVPATGARAWSVPSPRREADPAADDLVQLLDPAGQRVERDDYAVDASADELRSLYRDLVLVRRVDTEATALQRQGELGIWPSLRGQEAAQVGSGRALRADDHAFPSYREHGVAWCRGIDPVAVLGLYRGASHGGWDPTEHGMHLYTMVVGAQALHATGYAMGMQRDDCDGAAIAYFGDGATAQGDINEALTFASVVSAPVVFFCQNNQWAISAPVGRQSRAPLHHRARGFGLPGVRVDGNDVLAVLAVTRAALDRARSGSGPTFVEAHTYRMAAHTTSDDPSRYRDAAEVDAWARRDPLDRVRAHLLDQGMADPTYLADLDAEADELAARLREVCRSIPDPHPLEMFDHVYREPHPLLEQERSALAWELSSAPPAGQAGD